MSVNLTCRFTIYIAGSTTNCDTSVLCSKVLGNRPHSGLEDSFESIGNGYQMTKLLHERKHLRQCDTSGKQSFPVTLKNSRGTIREGSSSARVG
mmetsp:Transcript_43791/g.82119  ORF Transcript_43791/g.82119 Transcript_43791/m.82119 type:complete len:94 (-) Transcript_43791:137-418(-)